MNYLAHFQLAQHGPGLTVGALLGDYVKGPLSGQYEPGIEKGIALHRRIDAHTDLFVQQHALHQYFPSSFRRYLGIMLDLYFDFLLTHNWQQYETRSLTDFSNSTIAVLNRHTEFFPPNCVQFFYRMREHKLLECYGEPDTQRSILTRLSQRLPAENPLSECWMEMSAQRHNLEPAFAALYEELQQLADDSSG